MPYEWENRRAELAAILRDRTDRAKRAHYLGLAAGVALCFFYSRTRTRF